MGFFKLLITVSLLVISSPGVADDASEAKAREWIEKGRTCIAKEDFACALEAFKTSYELRPKSWVLFNIAMCQKATHRYVDAIASFRLFLKAENNPSTATLGLAKEALSELEQMVGKVRLVEAPDGAMVSIDGEEVATTPLAEPLVMDPGRHVLNISKDKFKTLNVEVVVASGAEIEVRADLENPKAEIKVSCDGERTVIFVDDTAVGSCPFHGEVSAGVHEIKVIEPGKQTFTKTVEVSAGATLLIEVELTPVIELNPPTFISDPGVPEVSKLNWGLKVGGIAAFGFSAVSFGLGGLFTYKWNDAYDKVDRAVAAVNAANRPDNQTGYDEAFGIYKEKKSTALGFRNAMVSCYALGGGLLAVGAALLVWNMMLEKESDTDQPVSLGVAPGGVAGTF